MAEDPERYDRQPPADSRGGRRLVGITAIFIVVQALIWLIALELLWYADRSISDIPVYYDYAGRMAEGLLPYRDFASEYPPVAMLLISLPRLLSGSAYDSFTFWFELQMLLFSSGAVALIAKLGWLQWHSLRRVTGALVMYSIFILALGSIVKARFDVAVAFMMLASVICFVTDRKLLAWILIGIGLMTKVVPLLLAPVFVIAHLRRRQVSYMWMGPLVAFGVSLVIALPFIFVSAGGFAASFLYHAERPLQLESSWASILLLRHSFGSLNLSVLNSYGSHNVFSYGSDELALISGPVTAVLLLAGYLLFWKVSRRSGSKTGIAGARLSDPGGPGSLENNVLRFCMLAVATFIAGGKVFSPQFMIWLMPMAALISGRDRRLVLALFTAGLLLTQWEFPQRYWNLFMLERDIIVIVAVRNLAVVVLGIMIAAGAWRQRVLVARRSQEAPREPSAARLSSAD